MNESNDQTDALIGQLRQLQPAQSKVDFRQAFYQAGYEACRSQTESRNSRHPAVGIAATLLAVVVSAPTSYHFGKTVAMSRGSLDVAQTDSSETIHEPLTPASGLPPAVQIILAETESKRSGIVELAASPRARNQLVSWMNPLSGIAKSARLDRQSESMVTTSHASLFALESSIRNLSEFPFSLPSPSELGTSLETESADPNIEEPRPTLAVGDLQAFAIALESTR